MNIYRGAESDVWETMWVWLILFGYGEMMDSGRVNEWSSKFSCWLLTMGSEDADLW